MFRLLIRPRWVALSIAVALIAVVCVELGQWQLRRLDHRRAINAAITAARAVPPEPAESLLRPGTPLSRDLEWRTIRIIGRYDPAGELLVRNRTLDARAGYYVLTPLVTGSGAALLINRGWVAAGATAAARPDVPRAQAGEVEVTGRLRTGELASGHTGLPAGQIDRIDIAGVAGRLPYPVYGAYAELTEQRPAPGPAPRLIPAAELGEGPHLVYAIQWFIFAFMAVGGWVLLFRRDLTEQRADERPVGGPQRVAV